MMKVIIPLVLCQLFLHHLVLAKQKCSPWAVPNYNPELGPKCICRVYSNHIYKWCMREAIDIGACLTQDSDNGSVVYGACPYVTKFHGNLTLKSSDYGSLHFPQARTVQPDELDELMCGSLNRQGLLCSQCKPGYGPAVHAFGFMCADCDESFSGWGLYLFLQLFPLTMFYAIVIVFHVQAASPPLIAFVLFCQAYLQTERSSVFIRTNIEKFSVPVLFKTAQTLCGFWNLDFFRHIIPPFCVDSRLSSLHALWLDFISAYYPLLLIVITYTAIELHARNFKPVVILWKPFHKCCVRIRRGLDPKSSIINAFASFLVLSIGKIIFLTGNSVYRTYIHPGNEYNNGTSRLVLYHDPSQSQADPYFAYLYAIPIINLSMFAFLPAAFLCLYPTRIFRKILNCFRFNQSSLLIFLDVFQGHFKDGTGGTCDYRALSGLYIILQVVKAVSYTEPVIKRGLPSSRDYILLMMLLLTVVLFAILQPYKRKWDNYVTIINFALMLVVLIGFRLILVSESILYRTSTVTFLNIFLLLPHVVFYGYALYKVVNNLGITKYLKNSTVVPISKIKSIKLRHGSYERLQGINCEEPLPDRLENPQYYR